MPATFLTENWAPENGVFSRTTKLCRLSKLISWGGQNRMTWRKQLGIESADIKQSHDCFLPTSRDCFRSQKMRFYRYSHLWCFRRSDFLSVLTFILLWFGREPLLPVSVWNILTVSWLNLRFAQLGNAELNLETRPISTSLSYLSRNNPVGQWLTIELLMRTQIFI